MAATELGAGGLLGRKLGPLPMWVWIGLGVAAAYFYTSRKNAAAQAAAGTGTDPTTSALANQGAAAMQYGYTAPDLASMISNLQGQVALLGGGNSGTTGTGASSPGSTGNPAVAPVAPVLSGSGYWVPNSEVPVTGQGGHTYMWIPNAQVRQALAPGTPIFVQTMPGYFSQVGTEEAGGTAKMTARLAPGTKSFVRVT
jgi:hypothetical protein